MTNSGRPTLLLTIIYLEKASFLPRVEISGTRSPISIFNSSFFSEAAATWRAATTLETAHNNQDQTQGISCIHTCGQYFRVYYVSTYVPFLIARKKFSLSLFSVGHKSCLKEVTLQTRPWHPTRQWCHLSSNLPSHPNRSFYRSARWPSPLHDER